MKARILVGYLPSPEALEIHKAGDIIEVEAEPNDPMATARDGLFHRRFQAWILYKPALPWLKAMKMGRSLIEGLDIELI